MSRGLGDVYKRQLEKLQKLYNLFKMIEQRLTQKKAKLKVKLPEIEKTYGSLVQMEEQSKLGEALTVNYELAQSVFAKAKINVHENDKVRRVAHALALARRACSLTRLLPHALAPSRAAPRRGPRAPGVPVARRERDARVQACGGDRAARQPAEGREAGVGDGD